MAPSMDRISTLSPDLQARILCYLATPDEAVRTSVLSSQWRTAWKFMDRLAFGMNDGDHPVGQGRIDNIYHHLHGHEGSLFFFEIFHNLSLRAVDVEQFLQILYEKGGLKELSIFNIGDQKLPLSIQSIPQFELLGLRSLHLSNCILTLPDGNWSLGGIEELRLSRMELTQGAIETLLLRCQNLEILEILQPLGPTSIIIDHPNIRRLNVSFLVLGTSGFQILDAPSLESAGFGVQHLTNSISVEEESSHFSNLLGQVARVSYLNISSFTFEYLSYISLSVLPTWTFNRLTRLVLCTEFIYEGARHLFVKLLDRMPSLHTLHIQEIYHNNLIEVQSDDSDQEFEGYLDNTEHLHCIRHSLRVFILEGVNLHSPDQVDLLYFVLKNAHFLRTMHIICWFTEHVDEETRSSLVNFKGAASNNVNIRFQMLTNW